MKKALLFVTILAIGTVALLYKKSGDQTKETVRAHMEYNYPYDKKDVFNDDANSDLAEVDNDLKQISEKAAVAGDPVKADAQLKIKKLADERAALAKKLDTLKSAKESNWNDLKSDYQKSEDELKADLKQTWQWVLQKTPS